jgi:hypothetical protein
VETEGLEEMGRLVLMLTMQPEVVEVEADQEDLADT